MLQFGTRVLSHLSHTQLFVTSRTVARQAPLSVAFSRRQCPVPSSRGSSQPRDQKHGSSSPAWAGEFFTASATWEAHSLVGWRFTLTAKKLASQLICVLSIRYTLTKTCYQKSKILNNFNLHYVLM